MLQTKGLLPKDKDVLSMGGQIRKLVNDCPTQTSFEMSLNSESLSLLKRDSLLLSPVGLARAENRVSAGVRNCFRKSILALVLL